MLCANPTEVRFIEQFSESNAAFRASDNESDSKEVAESMIDQLGRHPKSTLCLCEGYGHEQSIFVNDAKWIDVEFDVALDGGSIDHVCHSRDVPG